VTLMTLMTLPCTQSLAARIPRDRDPTDSFERGYTP